LINGSGVVANPVWCLVGPTGTGKSEAAIALAQHLPIEIISVDSAAVYRHMDIGTAKPALAIRQRYAHHLIDILDPNEAYSVGAFFEDTARLVREIQARKKIPLLVGGTMMYAHSLLQGLSPLPPKDSQIRDFWLREGEQKGWDRLHQLLQRIDPIAASKIAPHDCQRISRFLEVYTITGKPWSLLCQERKKWPFPIAFIGWDFADRFFHKNLLEKRFANMLKTGLIEEVKMLAKHYALTGQEPSLKAVGYHEAWLFLQGKITIEDVYTIGLKNTMLLVKRQRTWARKLPLSVLLDAQHKDNLTNLSRLIVDQSCEKHWNML
jgi:tRNA dimethylallyltransferase